MRRHFSGFVLAVTLSFFFANAFAQDESNKLAVYVYGASEAGVNKSLSSKLLSTLANSGKYAEITDPGTFQDNLAKGNITQIAQIAQTAKQNGAYYVCVVAMTEAFGVYSISARIIKTSDLQVLKTGTIDHALKSMNDLTAVSDELTKQLFPSPLAAAPPATNSPPPATVDRVAAAQAVVKSKCAKTYNRNDVLYIIKNDLPKQLKYCSSELSQDMSKPALFGGKKLEPNSFLKSCVVDGISNGIPEGFPGTDKIISSLERFVQGILISASAPNGDVDPKKLVSEVGSMDVNLNSLLGDIDYLTTKNECIVGQHNLVAEADNFSYEVESDKKDESAVSFGPRLGYNTSSNFQMGFAVDIKAVDWLSFQSGGTLHLGGYTSFLVSEIISFKLSVLRLNIGPYLNISRFTPVFGASLGFGFDIKKAYIGTSYNYGFNSYYSPFSFTLGMNI